MLVLYNTRTDTVTIYYMDGEQLMIHTITDWGGTATNKSVFYNTILDAYQFYKASLNHLILDESFLEEME